MTTIYDVARRAGVSPATVSRVLNGRASVDPEMAARVRQAAQDLDYRPNAVARSLRRSRTSLWAVIISDIGNPFFTSMVRGVEDVAQEAGFSVVLCNGDEDPEKEARYVAAALAERMAGVIISSSGKPALISRLVQAAHPGRGDRQATARRRGGHRAGGQHPRRRAGDRPPGATAVTGGSPASPAHAGSPPPCSGCGATSGP